MSQGRHNLGLGRYQGAYRAASLIQRGVPKTSDARSTPILLKCELPPLEPDRMTSVAIEKRMERAIGAGVASLLQALTSRFTPPSMLDAGPLRHPLDGRMRIMDEFFRLELGIPMSGGDNPLQDRVWDACAGSGGHGRLGGSGPGQACGWHDIWGQGRCMLYDCGVGRIAGVVATLSVTRRLLVSSETNLRFKCHYVSFLFFGLRSAIMPCWYTRRQPSSGIVIKPAHKTNWP